MDPNYTYKITIILHSDADPSEILDQSMEAAERIADYCGGEADENEVRVARADATITTTTKTP